MEPIPASEREMAELPAFRAMVGWGPGGEFMPLLRSGSAQLLCIRDWADRLVATGIATRFGSLGFIGNMITLPEVQGQGLGKRVFAGLMDWLEEGGVTRVDLEATPAGRPMYENHFGFEVRWESLRATLEPGSALEPDPDVRQVMTASDWSALAELDTAAFGANRLALIQVTAATPDAKLLALSDGDGMLAYGLIRGPKLGPVVGGDPESTARVVRSLVAGSTTTVSCGTGGHEGTRPFWEALGFTITPYDTRMTYGEPPDDRPEWVYALLSGGLG